MNGVNFSRGKMELNKLKCRASGSGGEEMREDENAR